MYIKCTGNRPGDKSVGYYKIVESYRDKNQKVQQRILVNLGPMPHSKANNLRAVLEANRNPDIVCTSLDNIIVTGHKAYLDIMICNQILKNWKLDRLLSDFNYVVPMIINRCINPRSKISVTRWVKKTILPQLLDVDYDDINPYSIYRELDQLNQLTPKIQKLIFDQLDETDKSFFYDITSTYFEGENCIICAKGYSRDHRADKKQVVIALVINTQGYPLYWQVLPGNTQDVTTLIDLAINLKKRFQLNDCTLIFDRGMVSDNNLNYLQGEHFHYVTALDRNQISGINLFNLSLFEDIDLEIDIPPQLTDFKKYDDNCYYQEKSKDKTRYVLGFNRNMRKDQLGTFNKNLKNALAFISEKNNELAKAKKSRNKKVLIRQINKKLNKFNLKKVINYEIKSRDIQKTKKNGDKRTVHSFKIHASINKEKKKEITKLFGLCCFTTRLSQQQLNTEKIISCYHSKYLIEQSFRIMKDMVELRPVRLTIKERVKAHVTVCVLSYLLLITIENILKNDSNLNMSVAEALEESSDCMVDIIEIEKQDLVTRNITKPSNLQKKILNALGLKKLVRKSHYNKYLQKMGDE